MPARKFLDLLEKQGLLDPSVIAGLRGQVEKASSRVTPEAVAKKLVDAGHLTKFQATKLVGEAKALAKSGDKTRKPAKKSPRPAPKPKRPPEEDLLLTELGEEETPQRKSAPESDTRRSDPAPSGLEPVQGGLEPMQAGLEPMQQGLQPLGGGLAGGLDPLGGPGGLDDIADPGTAQAGGQLAAAPKKKGWFGRRKAAPAGYAKAAPPPDNIWDTKLILIGSAALLLLFVAGGFLFYSLTKGTAQELFNEAERDYSSESYSQAIDKYEMFTKNYEANENASLAKVRIGMARIWQNASDPSNGLDMAKKILPTIEEEEAFDQAREELASILPEIARKFSDRALNATNTTTMSENLIKTEEAMTLVNNASYVPTSLRTQVQGTINQVLETIDEVNHVLKREQDLTSTMQEIATASNQGDMPKVYALRDDLLDKYPGLEANAELQKQLLEVSLAERKLVQLGQPTYETSTAERDDVGELVVMATNAGEFVAEVDQDVVVIRVAGAVYCLNAKDGALLWRRLVGDGTSLPIRTGVEVDANVVLNDARTHELLCLQPRTGELVWRTMIGEPFLGPERMQDGALAVVTEKGAIIKINAADGAPLAQATTPLPAAAPLAVTTRRPTIFYLAEHTNLYVHSEAETEQDGVQHKALECREVFYLGHKAGSVATGPVVLLGYVFVAVNSGPGVCDLHVLRIDDEGVGVRKAQNPIRLRGRVVVTPAIANRRLVVTTDLGSIYVFDVNPTPDKGDDPVTRAVGDLTTERTEPLISYMTVHRAKLWVGDNKLSRYDIQVAKEDLSLRWNPVLNDVVRAPIQHVGNAIIYARTQQGGVGVIVSAVKGDLGEGDLREGEIWTTTIAADAGAAFFTPDGKLRAVSSSGRLYGADAGESGLAKLIGDASGDGVGGAYLHAVDLGDQKMAVCSLSDRKRFVLVDKASGDQIAQKQMAVATSPTADPVFAAGGLAVGLEGGEVALINPEDGAPLAEPFFPPVAAGKAVRWFRAAPAGANDEEILITDNRRNVFRLAAKGDEVKYIEELSRRELENDIISPPASLDELVFVGIRGIPEPPKSSARAQTVEEPNQERVGDLILPLTLVGLRPAEPMSLRGRIVQGPYRVGSNVYFVSDQEGLICLGSTLKTVTVPVEEPTEPTEAAEPTEASKASEAGSGGSSGSKETETESSDEAAAPKILKTYVEWQQAVQGARLAGPPMLEGDELVVAFYSGELWRLNPATGEILARFALEQPISSPPTASADRLAFPDANGGLRLVARESLTPSP